MRLSGGQPAQHVVNPGTGPLPLEPDRRAHRGDDLVLVGSIGLPSSPVDEDAHLRDRLVQEHAQPADHGPADLAQLAASALGHGS